MNYDDELIDDVCYGDDKCKNNRDEKDKVK